MIHNPDVNEDLMSHGIQFIQDTDGSQLISWEELHSDDIVIIPAFGTTVEIENKLLSIGVNVSKYNTTCPFVEKVWNRSERLGTDKHTVIIHGKRNHEETRATFSRSLQNAPTIILKDIHEAEILGEFILGQRDIIDFPSVFAGKYSRNFEPERDLVKIGVVNQTTMLAQETQEITDYLRGIMVRKFGDEAIKNHIADTRDTLCYATNDNQTATFGLLEKEADLALVIGGYNSSNTTHLVELLERKFKTYFIKSAGEIVSENEIHSFDIHAEKIVELTDFLPSNRPISIILTSGASCPDSIVDGVIQRILALTNPSVSAEEALLQFLR
jgi:4-hydroxy-3-methylbut-2-enyl diphosphate reductase